MRQICWKCSRCASNKMQFISVEIATRNELLWRLYNPHISRARDLAIITAKFKSIVDSRDKEPTWSCQWPTHGARHVTARIEGYISGPEFVTWCRSRCFGLWLRLYLGSAIGGDRDVIWANERYHYVAVDVSFRLVVLDSLYLFFSQK